MLIAQKNWPSVVSLRQYVRSSSCVDARRELVSQYGATVESAFLIEARHSSLFLLLRSGRLFESLNGWLLA